MVAHSALTGADLHEPKGVAAATAGQVYVANGSASGAWMNKDFVVVDMVDVTVAEVIYVYFPRAVTITKVTSVISNAFITADNVVTVANAAGTSMGTITITQSGSAAGDIDSLTPVANNTIAAGATMRLTSNGGGATATRCTFTIEYTVTA